VFRLAKSKRKRDLSERFLRADRRLLLQNFVDVMARELPHLLQQLADAQTTHGALSLLCPIDFKVITKPPCGRDLTSPEQYDTRLDPPKVSRIDVDLRPIKSSSYDLACCTNDMRLVSYNILDGGEGRADPLAEVIEAQRPDIVSLIEADFPWALERIAHRLKTDYIHAPGKKGSVALLSRWPITESINHGLLRPKLTKSMLEAKVAGPDGRTLVFGALHFHAHALEKDEQVREAEVAEVLDVFAKYRQFNTPHVLMGDFNSNSPVQRIDPNAVKESTREEWQKNGGQIPRRVIQKLLGAGYIDTLHAVDAEKAATIGTFSTQHPGQRVDFIFSWGVDRSKLKSAWVEQDRLAKYASDHFPIGAEIEDDWATR
jgi:endonuclease/exonuclease/phosphatase family metal-dependent hydrolase